MEGEMVALGTTIGRTAIVIQNRAMSELVEQVARAIAGPMQDAWQEFVTEAESALSVLEPRIEALERELAEAVAAERERCARIAERASEARAFEATLSDDRAFVGARLEAADIAAAIRNGERG